MSTRHMPSHIFMDMHGWKKFMFDYGPKKGDEPRIENKKWQTYATAYRVGYMTKDIICNFSCTYYIL
jgi:hypothetical protein